MSKIIGIDLGTTNSCVYVMLTTSLLYNGEDRLVLLGTTLWEQSLSGKTVANADRYALAVFPGAWNQLQAPHAAFATANSRFSHIPLATGTVEERTLCLPTTISGCAYLQNIRTPEDEKTC